ncbi:hypothetical protein [Ruminococcus sp.]|uniref:hypothetical protein n=1 Tax=Ruminococcus sp. TaxID=41978 RepID=UPI003AAB76E7
MLTKHCFCIAPHAESLCSRLAFLVGYCGYVLLSEVVQCDRSPTVYYHIPLQYVNTAP